MTFSERNPKLFEAAEEKIKKQVEARGLDYDTIKTETGKGMVYEIEYDGIYRIGDEYMLKITPLEPAFIDYRDIFWVYETQDRDNDTYVVMSMNDGESYVSRTRNAEDAGLLLDMIKKVSPDVLIGKYKERFNALAKSLKKDEEPPKKPDVPGPVPALPQSTVDSMHKKIEYIISLSKKLAETDKKCYVEFSEPLDETEREKITEWCRTNGVYLPEPYMILLSHANRFVVDFTYNVGYFRFEGFDTETSPEKKYNRSREQLLAREYDYYINCIGFLGGFDYKSICYNPYTGAMSVERTGGFGWEEKYIPIKDFEKEILDKVIEYLEKNERKGKLLKEAPKNPMRKYYDRLLGYMEERDDPDMAVYAPLTKKEITAWEKTNDIKLPRDYKNWLMLSDGGEFADKSIFKLEELDTKNLAVDPGSGKGYITIASLSGASDCLVFDPKTKEMFVLTDDGKCKAGDFVFHVIQEGFDSLEEDDD